MKALRELHKNKQIESRVAGYYPLTQNQEQSSFIHKGKQIVYHALQSTPNSTPETIAAEESTATQIQEQIDKLKISERKTRAELTACCAKPLLSELRDEIEKLREEVASTAAQLARIRDSNPLKAGPCDGDSSVGLDLEWKCWKDLVAVRRRICRALWDRCTEVLPGDMSRGELWVSLINLLFNGWLLALY